jgi:hypothetical protein
MPDFGQHRVVLEIKNRTLSRSKINLNRFIRQVLPPWTDTPRGFKFTITKEGCQDLYFRLLTNDLFAKDTKLGQVFQNGASFREVSKSDSLHFVLMFGKPQEGATQDAYYCNVHIDSVGICPEKNIFTAECRYDYDKLLKHIDKDLIKGKMTPKADIFRSQKQW